MDLININYSSNSPLKSKLVSYPPFLLFNKHLYSTFISLCERPCAKHFTNVNSFPVIQFEIFLQQISIVLPRFTEDIKTSKTSSLLLLKFHSWDKTLAQLQKEFMIIRTKCITLGKRKSSLYLRNPLKRLGRSKLNHYATLGWRWREGHAKPRNTMNIGVETKKNRRQDQHS